MPTVEKAPPRARGAKESLERSIGRSSSRNASEAECSLDGGRTNQKALWPIKKVKQWKLKRLQLHNAIFVAKGSSVPPVIETALDPSFQEALMWRILASSADKSFTEKWQVRRWSVQGWVNDEWRTDLPHHWLAPCIAGVYSNYRFKGIWCKYDMYIHVRLFWSIRSWHNFGVGNISLRSRSISAYTSHILDPFFRNDLDPQTTFLDLAALLNLRVKLLIQVLISWNFSRWNKAPWGEAICWILPKWFLGCIIT